ncbi:TolC family protein [Geobacter sp. SVR]|uniref:TolC family protein n=1 Tax=Geobacter sp. SVR TaxID=2495594 RepID=UPI00143EF771|nr:TolC family protein [Geobacter sp. SVR]BCS54274.1 RND transporter [Geobacter sp. SVR]GCF85867.1 RND transporter [Geobacter sp. SVR]
MRKILTCFATFLYLAGGAHAADQSAATALPAAVPPASIPPAEPPLTLSLNEAIRRGAEKNLDIRAELYTPAQFEADVNRNRAIYDPLFNLQTIYTDSKAPLLTNLGTDTNLDRTFLFDASLSQLLWTGGTATLAFDNSFTNTNTLSPLRDFWQSQLGLTFSQPLLKNFGREATEVNINISRLSKFASLEHFKFRLMSLVAQVRIEYFKLYSLRKQLEVKRVSLVLARKILSDTKARVAVGVLPAMEILNAEFGATSREKDVIDAERAVEDQIDVLRVLLQIEGSGDIVTSDIPSREPVRLNEQESIKLAMSRPDIKEQRRNQDINELQTRVLNDRIKPDLSLVLSGSMAGLDHTYPRTLDRMTSFDFPVWSVGFNFSYPLGNRAAENDYRKSRLKTEQTALQIRSLEENTAKDVKAAIRAVNSGFTQIDVTDRERAYAEERLKAFIRKNEVGLATTKDVLDVENDLAAAKSNQIIAQVNYDNAITQYLLVTGEILQRENVRVVEGDADKLYSNIH